MLGKQWVLAVALLSLMAVPGLGADQGDERVVTYSYRGDGSAIGTMEGTCASFGAVPAPTGSFDFTATAVTLTTAVIWVNRTSSEAPPQPIEASTPLDYDRKETTRPLANGMFRIVGGPEAYVSLKPAGHPAGADSSIHARFTASSPNWTSVRDGASSHPHFTGREPAAGPQTWFNGLDQHDGKYPAGARAFQVQDGRVTLEGETVIHLRGSTIIGPNVTVTQPPYVTEVANTTAPLNGAQVTTQRLEEAFLKVDSFKADWTGFNGNLVCGSIGATVTGNVTVYQASGQEMVGNTIIPFVDQVLQIAGVFALEEQPHVVADPFTVESEARGDIQMVGLDYHPVAGSSKLDVQALEIGIGIVLVGALATALKQGLPAITVLLTRLRDREIDAHPIRQQILATLTESPVLSETALAEGIGVSRGAIRHHATVLYRAKRIRRARLASQQLIALASHSDQQLRAHLICNDLRLKHVHEAMTAGMRRSEAANYVATKLGVTGRAARRYVSSYLELSTYEGGDDA